MNVFDMLRTEIEAYMETVYGCKIGEVVEYQTKNDGKEISYIVQGLVEAYGAISTVEKEYNNGWIPCSERLPEDRQRCLTTARIYFVPDHVDEPDNYIGTELNTYSKEFGWLNGNEVIAWQPLPEAYEGV